MSPDVSAEPGSHLAGESLSNLYQDRHAQESPQFRAEIWEVLCDLVFQRYVKPEDTVLDLGAGWCEFINAIRCRNKIAIDLNPDLPKHARDAKTMIAPANDLSPIARSTVDVVFSSNLLEHMPNKMTVLQVLRECNRVLRPGGTLIVVMPNVRYLPGRYWDYFDHITPLSHVSLAEGMRLAGFDIVRVVPRFVPYSVKSRLIPKSTLVLRIYLRLPFLWAIFGRQMIVIGRRRGPAERGPGEQPKQE